MKQIYSKWPSVALTKFIYKEVNHNTVEEINGTIGDEIERSIEGLSANVQLENLSQSVIDQHIKEKILSRMPETRMEIDTKDSGAAGRLRLRSQPQTEGNILGKYKEGKHEVQFLGGENSIQLRQDTSGKYKNQYQTWLQVEVFNKSTGKSCGKGWMSGEYLQGDLKNITVPTVQPPAENDVQTQNSSIGTDDLQNGPVGTDETPTYPIGTDGLQNGPVGTDETPTYPLGNDNTILGPSGSDTQRTINGLIQSPTLQSDTIIGSSGNGDLFAESNDLLGTNAVSPEAVYAGMDIAEQLQFLNFFNFEELSDKQKVEFDKYVQDIVTSPEKFEKWVEDNNEPTLKEAYKNFMERQRVGEQFSLFTHYLSIKGMGQEDIEASMGQVLGLVQTKGISLESALNLNGVTPAQANAQKKLKSYFPEFKKDFDLMGDIKISKFQSQHEDRLEKMAKLARNAGDTRLAAQIYEQLLAKTVAATPISTEQQKQIDKARQEISNELGDDDIKQGLVKMGVANPTDGQINQARELTIDQVMKSKKLEILIGGGAIDLSDPKVAEYKDMMGIDVGFWDFDLADDTWKTLIKEALITAVIGVATMGTGLIVGGLARGAMIGGRIAIGSKRAWAIGATFDTIGAQTGYSLSHSGIQSNLNGTNFLENFSDDMSDPRLWLANGVSMGVFRGMQGLGRSNKHGLKGKVGLVAGGSYAETAAMTGDVNPFTQDFGRQFMMSALFNSFAIKQAGKLGNAKSIDDVFEKHGANTAKYIQSFKTPSIVKTAAGKAKSKIKNPFTRKPKLTAKTAPAFSGKHSFKTSRGPTKPFTKIGNLRYDKVANGKPLSVNDFSRGETMGFYKVGRKIGQLEYNAAGNMVFKQGGKVIDTIPAGGSKVLSKKIDGDWIRITNKKNLTITKNPTGAKTTPSKFSKAKAAAGKAASAVKKKVTPKAKTTPKKTAAKAKSTPSKFSKAKAAAGKAASAVKKKVTPKAKVASKKTTAKPVSSKVPKTKSATTKPASTAKKKATPKAKVAPKKTAKKRPAVKKSPTVKLTADLKPTGRKNFSIAKDSAGDVKALKGINKTDTYSIGGKIKIKQNLDPRLYEVTPPGGKTLKIALNGKPKTVKIGPKTYKLSVQRGGVPLKRSYFPVLERVS